MTIAVEFHKKAIFFFTQKEFKKSLYYFNKSIYSNPDMVESLNGKALVLRELERFEEAIELLKESTRKFPQYFELFYNISDILRICNRTDEAIYYNNIALSIRSDHYYFWILRCSLLRTKNKMTEAIFCADTAISLDPNNEDGHYLKGEILFNEGSYKSALCKANSCLRINHNSFKANILRAQCFFQLKEYELSLEVFNIIIENNPDSIEAILGKSDCLNKMGLFFEELKLLKNYLKLDKSNSEIYIRISYIYLKHDKKHKALKMIEKAFEIDSSNPIILNQMGEILFLLGEFQKALDCFTNACTLDSRSIKYLSNKTITLFKLEIFDDAFFHLEKVEEMYVEDTNKIVKSDDNLTVERLIARKSEFHERFIDYQKISSKDQSKEYEHSDSKVPRDQISSGSRSAFSKFSKEQSPDEIEELESQTSSRRHTESDIDQSQFSPKISKESESSDVKEVILDDVEQERKTSIFSVFSRLDLVHSTKNQREYYDYLNDFLSKYLELIFISSKKIKDLNLFSDVVIEENYVPDIFWGSTQILSNFLLSMDEHNKTIRNELILENARNITKITHLIPSIAEISTNAQIDKILGRKAIEKKSFLTVRIASLDSDIESGIENNIKNLAINDGIKIIAGLVSGSIASQTIKTDIVSVINSRKLDHIIEENSDEELKEMYHKTFVSEGERCIVMYVTSIEYENLILNYPEIIKKILSQKEGKKIFPFLLNSNQNLQKLVLEYLQHDSSEKTFDEKLELIASRFFQEEDDTPHSACIGEHSDH